jgi:hypothetical protein
MSQNRQLNKNINNKDKDINSIKNFTSGICTGIINTYIFNPYDKALYMMVKTETSFFTRTNWTKPYCGVTQSLAHRVISYGLYFPFMDMYKNKLNKYYNGTDINKTIIAGSLSGSTIGLLINPVNLIKTQNWNNNTSIGLITLGKQIIDKYGYLRLMRGIGYTIVRDNVFCVSFAGLAYYYNSEKKLLNDVLIGSCSTTLSAPINYFRSNVLFAPLNDKAPTIKKIYTDLILDTNKQTNKISYVATQKFCIGWGTLRVAFGMAMSRQLYELFKIYL